ncbi:hypothetical protein BJ508DRAFT_327847 [Ascobolus immersus RN42]|uniref:Uncharacterized protein n=1 Tax=Ascobolus immersus RN42 TaxID=1160509 RepID=A0A3N4I1N6_ASCIM|nr:hypothetical protein BJ508DRAFT_327847 [Ascobolus immersus RN42]
MLPSFFLPTSKAETARANPPRLRVQQTYMSSTDCPKNRLLADTYRYFFTDEFKALPHEKKLKAVAEYDALIAKPLTQKLIKATDAFFKASYALRDCYGNTVVAEGSAFVEFLTFVAEKNRKMEELRRVEVEWINAELEEKYTSTVIKLE